MRSIAVLLAVLSAFGATAPLRGQEPATPEGFAPTYFAAMRSGDWTRVAALMHPEAVAQFKGMFRDLVAVDSSRQLLQLFGVPDTAAYASAPPERLFASFMGTVAGAMPDMKAVLASAAIEPIGHVEEAGTGLTLVVFRMRMNVGGITMSKLDVLPLKRANGAWRAMLTGDMEGIAAVMKRQIGK